MSQDITITRKQLMVIRQLSNDKKAELLNSPLMGLPNDDRFKEDIKELIDIGFIEENKEGLSVTNKALDYLGKLPSGEYKERIREIERVKNYIQKVEKVLTNIEELETRSDINSSEKFEQVLKIIKTHRVS